MKFADFEALCKREWEERRGDIQDLFLTGESWAEFSNELLLRPNQDILLDILVSDLADIRAGATCRYVTNPITRTRITVNDAILGKDQASVRYLVDIPD